MKRDVRIEHRYPHPPETVWRWLADREAMAEWLMPNTFAPVVGHRFEFRTKPAPGFDGIVKSTVLEIEPARRLAFTWTGGGIDTIVTFELVPDGSGTRVVFSQVGFAGPKGVLLSFMLGSGWKAMLGRKLPQLLASERGSPAPHRGRDKSLFWRIFDRVVSR